MAAGRRMSARTASAGYTLIELMVALVIMAVGLFSVVHLQFVSLRGVGYARERTDALMLANAIADELRTRALGWNNTTDFNDSVGALPPVFSDIELVDPPEDPADFKETYLRALTRFNEIDLAEGSGLEQAYLVNAAGMPLNGSDTASLANAKAIYRVHYTAYMMPLAPGITGGNQVVRLILFVSWDNTDYGEQGYAWTAWKDNFWRRHMVAVNVYLRRQRQG
jgi:prepilin-type N-terminal cleavage/methylation domain-containing protein